MDCQYPDCPNKAEFVCTARFEGTEETKRVCAEHKETAERIGLMLDFDVITTRVPDEN